MKPIIGSLLALLLSACGGEATLMRIIDNRSDYSLNILLYSGGYAQTDTLLLAPDQELRLSVRTYANAEEEADCEPNFDSAYVAVVGGGSLLKELQLEQNWEAATEQTSRVPPEYEHTCTFVITNSDIDL